MNTQATIPDIHADSSPGVIFAGRCPVAYQIKEN